MQRDHVKVGAGILIIAFILSFFILRHSRAEGDFSPQSIQFPYVVVEQDQFGKQLSTKNSLSNSLDITEIAEKSDFVVYPEDRLSIFPDINMRMGGEIKLTRAPIYFVRDGKRHFEFRSWQKTVGDLLTEKNIELGLDDKINFPPSTELENRLEIVITRVAITTVIEKEAINYKVVNKSNPNVEKGNKKILQVGKKGSKDKYYLVRREDGEEVSRNFIKSEVTLEPVDEIIEIGTKVVVYGNGTASIWKESNEMVAACNFVKKGTKVHVVNTSNGKSVDVTCMGGGLRDDRIIDLADTAFEKLGGTWSQGLIDNVRVEKYYSEN